MISYIAWAIVEWVGCGNLIFSIIRYLFLILVWALGILLNQKLYSHFIRNCLCFLGLFALTVSGSFAWILIVSFFGGPCNLAMFFEGIVSCVALVVFICMMRITMSFF